MDVGISWGVRSVHVGTITVTGTNLTGTATITAVDTAKTEGRGGNKREDDGTYHATRIVLTNSTTVTATRGGQNGYDADPSPYTMIERY